MMSGATPAAVYQYRRHRGIEMQVNAAGKVRSKTRAAKSATAEPAPPPPIEIHPVPVGPERPKSPVYVYIAQVRRGEAEHTYGVLGRDIVDATSRAAAAIHEDGGRIISMREHLEALG